MKFSLFSIWILALIACSVANDQKYTDFVNSWVNQISRAISLEDNPQKDLMDLGPNFDSSLMQPLIKKVRKSLEEVKRDIEDRTRLFSTLNVIKFLCFQSLSLDSKKIENKFYGKYIPDLGVNVKYDYSFVQFEPILTNLISQRNQLDVTTKSCVDEAVSSDSTLGASLPRYNLVQTCLNGQGNINSATLYLNALASFETQLVQRLDWIRGNLNHMRDNLKHDVTYLRNQYEVCNRQWF